MTNPNPLQIKKIATTFEGEKRVFYNYSTTVCKKICSENVSMTLDGKPEQVSWLMQAPNGMFFLQYDNYYVTPPTSYVDCVSCPEEAAKEYATSDVQFVPFSEAFPHIEVMEIE